MCHSGDGPCVTRAIRRCDDTFGVFGCARGPIPCRRPQFTLSNSSLSRGPRAAGSRWPTNQPQLRIRCVHKIVNIKRRHSFSVSVIFFLIFRSCRSAWNEWKGPFISHPCWKQPQVTTRPAQYFSADRWVKFRTYVLACPYHPSTLNKCS